MTNILIVGAGPTGLTAANVLAQSGVDFRIVERDSGPIDESRALIVHGRSLELFDKLGLGSAALREGQIMDGVYIMVHGKPSGHIPLQGHQYRTPYPFPLVLEQSKTQRLLLSGLEQTGGYVEWNTTLEGLEHDEAGITATLRHVDGSEELVHSRWIIGADGAGSDVRRATDLHLEGSTYTQSFFLADLEMDWAHGHDKLYLNITRTHFFGIFPMYGDKQFRLIGSLTPEQTEKRAITRPEVQQLIQKSGLDTQLSNPRWINLYRIHKRLAPRFRFGNIFLVGDAGHIHSPAGGQGMNTGIGDAFNLAWKLASVIKGEVYLNMLDSYNAERWPVAKRVLDMTDRNFDIETSTNVFVQNFRLLLAPVAAKLLSSIETGRNFMYNYLSQLDIAYPESPVVEDSTYQKHSIRAGDRAPYGHLTNDSNLFDLIRGVGHHIFLFEGQIGHIDLDAVERQLQKALEPYTLVVNTHHIHKQHQKLHDTYNAVKSTRSIHL